jgi:hypothetical protein
MDIRYRLILCAVVLCSRHALAQNKDISDDSKSLVCALDYVRSDEIGRISNFQIEIPDKASIETKSFDLDKKVKFDHIVHFQDLGSDHVIEIDFNFHKGTHSIPSSSIGINLSHTAGATLVDQLHLKYFAILDGNRIRIETPISRVRNSKPSKRPELLQLALSCTVNKSLTPVLKVLK